MAKRSGAVSVSSLGQSSTSDRRISTVCSGTGKLLNSAGDIAGQWKEDLEDFLKALEVVGDRNSGLASKWWSLFSRRGLGGY